MTIKYSDCLGVILAGGKSSRMGQDKATLTFRGNTLLSHCQQQLQLAGIRDVVVSGDNHGLADKFQDAGPVGGILSVIERHQPNALFILPVDLPLINASVIQQLRNKGQLSQIASFYQQHYIPLYLPINAFTEPALSALRVNLQNKALSPENKKAPSIRSLLANIPHQALPCEQPDALFNANTPEQWQALQHSNFTSKNYDNLS